jgi:hypothetical protein
MPRWIVACPSGSLLIERHSIGSTKAAFLMGRERNWNALEGVRCIGSTTILYSLVVEDSHLVGTEGFGPVRRDSWLTHIRSSANAVPAACREPVGDCCEPVLTRRL